MKKALLLSAVLLLLSGCARVDIDSDAIRGLLKKSTQNHARPTATMTKKYYNYYLPGEVGKKESTPLSEVFRKDGFEIIMNFNASAIIIDRFYLNGELDKKEQSSKSKSLSLTSVSKQQKQSITMKKDKSGNMQYQGIYKNGNNQYFPYELFIQTLDGKQYLLHLNGTIVDFYALIPAAEIKPAVTAMMKIMQSIEYDKKQIVADFSLKKAEQNRKDSLNYLNGRYAEEGFLIDQDYRETESPK